MKKITSFLTVGVLILLITLSVTSWAGAQSSDSYWTQPYPLSSQSGQVGIQTVFADSFGYIHLFWPETGLSENTTFLYYSRFDGETWSSPVDIVLAPASTRITATVDLAGNLHLLYSNRHTGDVFYTRSPIQQATSAQGWEKPRQLDISVQWMDFKVDSLGTYHLLFSGFEQDEPGVYHTNSFDEGQTWSRPAWLDPDKPADLTPTEIQLEMGAENSLHAVWLYVDQDFVGRWIRYSHSMDQGQNWSVPFTIDKVEAGSQELRLPAPKLSVFGEDVHVVWAGDFLTHRKHRISRDSGASWNQGSFIFGDLHGQAIGDGLGLDTRGRLHFFGQIRWPQGIYHAYWNLGNWSTPSMIYLIAQDAFDPIGDRIHAHRIRAAIRSGNQLVVTFTTSPSDPQSILYAMQITLADVPAQVPLPLPEQAAAPTFDAELVPASPTSLPASPTKRPTLESPLDTGPSGTNPPSLGLMLGVLPVFLLVVGIIIVRFLSRRSN
jgi:hypothetical protein